MTTTGLTLRFLRDDVGQPRVLFVRDRLGVCPVCGHEVIERWYAETSYHHLTVARLRELAAGTPEGFEQTCEQCGEALGADSVVRWALTYGYPQEPGLLQAFGRRQAGETDLVYALSPHRELDAQMLPEWDVPNDQSVAVFARLTETEVHAVTGRYLNLKAAWRRLLRAWLERPASRAAVIEMAPGYRAVVGLDAEAVAAALGRLREEAVAAGGEPSDVLAAPLLDPLHALVEHGPRDWLPDEWVAVVERGRPQAWVVGDVRVVGEVLRRALERLPVKATCELDAEWTAEVGFPVGGTEPLRRSVSLPALLLEALVTGSAPADWVGLFIDDCLVEVTGDGDA
jgi:hypothetical protein